MHERQIPIWFFVGGVLAVYGFLICSAGVYGWVHPPPPERMVKLWNYHADVWWGAVLLGLGLIYLIKFRPSKPETLTGETAPPDNSTSTSAQKH